MYPEDSFVFGFNKPLGGNYLNKHALLIFKNFLSNPHKGLTDKIKKLIDRVCLEKQAFFREYNHSSNTLVLEVFSF